MATMLFTSCAPKTTLTPSPVPGWEYVANEFSGAQPDLPESDQRSFDNGWDALVRGDLQIAKESLEKLGRRESQNASVQAAVGFLELRLGNRDVAENRFSKALGLEPSLAAAQAGKVLTAMASGQEEKTFERLRLLEKDHPDHVLVRHYLSSLQLKLAESKLQAARSSKNQKRYSEAAKLYREALLIAPEAGGLYAEAAEVELLGDEAEAAAEHAARAAELEPDSAKAHRLYGDALRQIGDIEKAIEAYEAARDLRPDDPALVQLISETEREFRRENLPPEYSEIEHSERISREELAALLYVRLRAFIGNDEEAQSRVIATDIADSWAREFIRAVVAAEIMSIYSNHTFQPESFVRKGDLAVALVAAWDLRENGDGTDATTDGVIGDVSPENRRYRPAALAVSLGLLSVDDEGRFEPLRFVSGLEAEDAVDALAERLVTR